MDKPTVFPDGSIPSAGVISQKFIELGIHTFQEACRYVQQLPYGYNSDKDDLLILFKENLGTCTTKHAVIGTLAAELDIAIEKNIGIYRMTEAIVTGTNAILEKYDLPYVPMLHCFLVYGRYRVDLTEGNRNGKNGAIDDFLHTEKVIPNVSGKDEYLRYRRALRERILPLEELKGVDMKHVLRAREEGLILLKDHINPNVAKT
jgi:rRNA maturation protein Nop10